MTKIVSWNVNSIRVRLPHLSELSKNVKPDVIMLQETKSTDDNFPNDEIEIIQEKIAESLGFELVDHRLELYGRPKVKTIK